MARNHGPTGRPGRGSNRRWDLHEARSRQRGHYPTLSRRVISRSALRHLSLQRSHLVALHDPLSSARPQPVFLLSVTQLQSSRPKSVIRNRFVRHISPESNFLRSYRADWELAAPSRKCMAGVPAVSWRCPAVLWGPLHLTQLGFYGNPLFEKMADFLYMHVKIGWICPMWPSAPLATKWDPMCKISRRLAVPLIKD